MTKAHAGSVFETSRQRWKLGIPIGAAIVCLGTIVAIQISGAMTESHRFALGLSTAAFAGGLAFCFMSIRCPRCRGPFFWQVAKAAGATEWLLVAINSRKCPICGYHSRREVLDGGDDAIGE